MKTITAILAAIILVMVPISVYAIHVPNDPIVTRNNDGETFITMRAEEAFAQPSSSIDGAMVTINQPIDVATITTALIAILTAIPSILITWMMVKTKLHSIREVFDVIDEALYDDKVSEEEYRALHEKLAKLVNK